MPTMYQAILSLQGADAYLLCKDRHGIDMMHIYMQRGRPCIYLLENA